MIFEPLRGPVSDRDHEFQSDGRVTRKRVLCSCRGIHKYITQFLATDLWLVLFGI